MGDLKRVHALTKVEDNAIWALFEYMCNERADTIDLYIDDLRIIAKLLDIDEKLFVEMTGCEPFTLEEYLDKIYGDDV